jgi:hypothetical protein
MVAPFGENMSGTGVKQNAAQVHTIAGTGFFVSCNPLKKAEFTPGEGV